MNDGFTGTFKALWLIYDDRRGLLLLITPICWLGWVFVMACFRISELFGNNYKDIYYNGIARVALDILSYTIRWLKTHFYTILWR